MRAVRQEKGIKDSGNSVRSNVSSRFFLETVEGQGEGLILRVTGKKSEFV